MAAPTAKDNPPPKEVKKEYRLDSGVKLVVFKGSIPDWPKMQNERPDKLSPLAVVNAANQRLCGGGGVDGMIHAKAGPELAAECQSKEEVRPGIRCPTGEAIETKGYQFQTDYIIHTCGPVYAKEREEECRRDLANAYRNSLLKTQALGVRCVAFAAISTGVFAYPFADATKVSLSVLQGAEPPLQEVWVVLFTQADFDTCTNLADDMGLRPWAAQRSPGPSPPRQPPPQLLHGPSNAGPREEPVMLSISSPPRSTPTTISHDFITKLMAGGPGKVVD